MNIRRPPPHVIAARKWEIRRRYSRKAVVGKRTRSMAAIRLSELTRWLHATIGEGCELEPGPRAETIARIFVHHLVVLTHGDRRASDWLQTYCPWIETRSRESMISEATHCPLKWSADRLAWKLGLTDADRSRLKIRTIGAVDVTKEQRAARRKERDAERKRRSRAAKRQSAAPRPQHID